MTPEDLDRVLLVGGSTRIPAVARRLSEQLGRSAEHALDPDLCVAMGAAVQGAILGGSTYTRILVDVSAHSLGVKTADAFDEASGDADHFAPIISRNTQVPVVRSEVFYTVVENQELVMIEVYQGESPRCSENTLIGEFNFDLEPAPMNSEVECQLGYDLEGVVRVVVSQRGTDNRAEVTMSSREGDGDVVWLETAGEAGAEREVSDVDNFIQRKAAAMAAELPASPLRDRLEQAREVYATVLADPDADDDAVDAAEDELLEALEDAEGELSADPDEAEGR